MARRTALAALALAVLPSWGRARPLKVLTYNAAGIPWVQRLAGERILELARRIGGYDVVALQEVWSGYDYQRLRRAAGFPYAVRREDPPVGNGLVLLSRIPVVEWRFYPFSGRAAPHALLLKGDADAICTKGVLAARLQAEDGRSLDVFDTHLISTDSPLENDAVRAGQILELDAAIRDFSGGRPYILLGDFNVGSGSPQYAMIRGLLGLEDPCWKDGRERCGPTFAGERIDYVLGPATGASLAFDRPYRVDGAPTLLSDHAAGVEAEVSLPAAPPAGATGRHAALSAARAYLEAGRARLLELRSRWPLARAYLDWWRRAESGRIDRALARLDAELGTIRVR